MKKLILILFMFLVGCGSLADRVGYAIGKGYAEGQSLESCREFGKGATLGLSNIENKKIYPAIEDKNLKKFWEKAGEVYLKEGRYEEAETIFKQICDYKHLEELIIIYLDKVEPDKAYSLLKYLENEQKYKPDLAEAYKRIEKEGIYKFQIFKK